ncbi:uncharacterized protein LOC142796293 [Rhipicephalus microplus]|uniref:uncharacterized protein LOC142796293 n=1 Tax=Rhipicephalus microplus TaxID=6941 RepID=UPI003F6CD5E2
MLSLAILVFTFVIDTAQATENTGVDAKALEGNDGGSGPWPPIHVVVLAGSGRKLTNEETSSSLISSTLSPTASPREDKTTETMESPAMSSERVTISRFSTMTMTSPSTSSETVPSSSTTPATTPTTKPTTKTTSKPTTKPAAMSTIIGTIKTTTKWTREPTTKPTSATTIKPIPQEPLPPDSLLCTLREGITRSSMQFPPDGLCTITTFYDLIKDADVAPILRYKEDLGYFLETAWRHRKTEYGVGITYGLCQNHTSVSALVNSPTTKRLLDTLWIYRVYHFGQVHQPIRGQGLRPEATGALAQCLQMVSALMNDKKNSVSRPSYTILHFPLFQPQWAATVARQLSIYPVDIFVAVAHHPEPDYLYTDCHMVPPTITSKRLLRHVPENSYPVRLGNTIWSLAYDKDKWSPNITFAVSLGMAGRWYQPKYPDKVNPLSRTGNYALGFPCTTEEHSPRGQMVNVTEACIDQRYSGNFRFDRIYTSEFTYNKKEKWLFTYDTARALRVKLCETKKNMTHLHYTFAAVNIQFEDAKDYCGYGEFPRLRALKALARFFAFEYTSPDNETACLKAT